LCAEIPTFAKRVIPSSGYCSGRDAYVDIKIWNPAVGVPALELGEESTMFLIDPKAFYHKPGAPVTTPPVASTQLLTQIGTYLLGDPKQRAEKPGLLGPEDLALFLDGRSPKTVLAVNKLLRKFALANPLLRQRGLVAVRLMYHNREFSNTGTCSFRSQRNFHARLPDPLETMYVTLHKSATLENQPRRFLDVPGDTRSRGIANLPIRTPQEFALYAVPASIAEAVFRDVTPQACAHPETEADGPDELSVIDVEDMNFSSQDAPDSQEPVAPSDVVTKLFPWQAPEAQYREWLNLFGHCKGRKRRLVDFFVGSGVGAVAACREGHKYVGVAHNLIHKNVVRDAVLLQIAMDLILNKRDGFHLARFLSRERSLSGQDGTPPAQASGIAAKSDVASKAAESDEESSSSSSS
jgi:hypothetical protein